MNEMQENDSSLPEMQSAASNKRYLNAPFDRNDPADMTWIKRWDRLLKVGGFSTKEIFIAGIKACLQSKEYAYAVNEMQDDIDLS